MFIAHLLCHTYYLVKISVVTVTLSFEVDISHLHFTDGEVRLRRACNLPAVPCAETSSVLGILCSFHPLYFLGYMLVSVS